MDDLISRQEAIDALDGEIEIIGKANAKAVLKYTQMVSDRIKALPPEQPEPRWIPVEDKERLPRDGQRVLVTDEDGEIEIAYYIDFSSIDESAEWWAHDYQCHPIAWREPPKPYERSEDENHMRD